MKKVYVRKITVCEKNNCMKENSVYKKKSVCMKKVYVKKKKCM